METNTKEAAFKAPETANDFAVGQTEITEVTENSEIRKHILLSKGRIAVIREGKGADCERATMEAAGDQTKYMTSMMASTITIEGKQSNMFELSELSMKDYMKLQIAFSEVNF